MSVMRVVKLLLLLTAAGVPVSAQQAEPEPLFTQDDAAWAAGFLAGTAALAPLDRYIAGQLQNPRSQESRFLRGTATGFRLLGHPGALVAAGGAWAIGRLADRPGLADVGLHAGTALVVGEGVTYLGKILVGRARPYLDATDPHDFGLLRGTSYDYQSFPSGHTTAAFAVAAALTSEAGERRPHDQWWIGTALYSAATLTGLSRMYNNEHWASDIVAAAAVGTFAGWKTVRYTHTHEGNEVDGIFLSVNVSGGRAAFLVLPFVP